MALLTLQAHPINRLALIPDGAAGIRRTLDAMIRAVRGTDGDINFLDLARSIVIAVPGKDYYGEIVAVQRWVKANVRYTRDPAGIETLHTPQALLAQPGGAQGDCDDQATCVAALLRQLGCDTRFVAVGTQAPGVFDHVFAEVKCGADWLSVETTEPVEVGWQPQGLTARMIRHVY